MNLGLAKGDRPVAVGDPVWAADAYGEWRKGKVVAFSGRKLLVQTTPGTYAYSRRKLTRRTE